MTTLTIKEQQEILRRVICHCGRAKKCGHAFCHRCFNRLSYGTQDALYQRVPGFGESYARAVEELKGNMGHASPRYREKARGVASGSRSWFGEE